MIDYLVEYVNSNNEVTLRDKTHHYKTVIYAGTKFAFDRIVSIIGLIILSPLMLIISISIKLDSKGPALFRQTRTGKNGKEFTLYKFRSMSVDNDVHDFKKGDEHTKVGSFLRKTSLDEIPQLISVDCCWC